MTFTEVVLAVDRAARGLRRLHQDGRHRRFDHGGRLGHDVRRSGEELHSLDDPVGPRPQVLPSQVIEKNALTEGLVDFIAAATASPNDFAALARQFTGSPFSKGFRVGPSATADLAVAFWPVMTRGQVAPGSVA